ncbi:bifunctional ADP-dependent NAD(P)H-hydrate dehydratase/NAD(P)H-hydrate epimerase [Corynebacterium auriscanis]|uniref:bifunctional ADP-dependent NAD(P)H-hydrate dehydratase/NAD(P)H-hydrate epimerase n=1 Tax=Corynebacterium auriscanis TaxID=99807 RepID=UPI0025B5FA8C|nr:bifunctional ADP-dependent NAD(P)H-hydrate dehydratase/NAD(P)H-hydrate epimerase [Corynebacterium auriscanis]WJY73186.1 Bifunctional NAD(P)H-hydrate repair enzyme Nnr [Corynebacterium auriscanis]
MKQLFTAQEVRQAENVLLEQQNHPDELMQIAAEQVARVADELLTTSPRTSSRPGDCAASSSGPEGHAAVTLRPGDCAASSSGPEGHAASTLRPGDCAASSSGPEGHAAVTLRPGDCAASNSGPEGHAASTLRPGDCAASSSGPEGHAAVTLRPGDDAASTLRPGDDAAPSSPPEGHAAGDEQDRTIVLLVGPGGNGGDALYAGARLLEMGHQVVAYAVTEGRRVKETACEAFETAGGQWVTELPVAPDVRMVIDGIAGLGSKRGLTAEVAEFLADAYSCAVPVVAVDVPSGVNADTGAIPDPITVHARGFEPEDCMWFVQNVPAHVRASVTVTFGGLRFAHALSPWCGRVELVDLVLPATAGRATRLALSAELLAASTNPVTYYEPLASLACGPVTGADRVSQTHACDSEAALDPAPAPARVAALVPDNLPFATEPEASDHKYSGGVVGLCAGSDRFPGAGIFAAVAAVRATSSAVRLFSPPDLITSFTPEALVTTEPLWDSLPSTPTSSSPHALVIGPGRGTDDGAAAELATALDSILPVVVDADALTLLSQQPHLLDKLRAREPFTLLTPHAGEFARLATETTPSPNDDPVAAAVVLAAQLNCAVLLKGRASVLATSSQVSVINAGSSWAATPGSGDVLAGLLGAYVARATAAIVKRDAFFPSVVAAKDHAGSAEGSFSFDAPIFHDHVLAGLFVHAVATEHAATTTYPGMDGRVHTGQAPASAMQIAQAVSSATAALTVGM